MFSKSCLLSAAIQVVLPIVFLQQGAEEAVLPQGPVLPATCLGVLPVSRMWQGAFERMLPHILLLPVFLVSH